MPNRIKVGELKYGMEGSPGFQGNRLAPFLIENIEINDEGRAELRPGYIQSQQEFEGDGEQLVVTHFVGDRDFSAKSFYQRIDRNATVALFGRRLFIARDNQPNIWYDITTVGKVSGVDSYEWELIKPTTAPTVTSEFDDESQPSILAVAIYPNPIKSQGRVEITVSRAVSVRVKVFLEAGRFAGDLTIKHLVPDPTAPENEADNFYNLSPGTYIFQAGVLANSPYDIEVAYLDDDNFVQTYNVDNIASLPAEEEFIDIDDIEDLGDLVPGTGMRGGNYLICYTYASSKHGIETPPSPHAQFNLARSTLEDEPNRIYVTLTITNYTSQIPEWADEVRFYVKRVGAETHYQEPKDVPFDYTHIRTITRDRLNIDIRGTFEWENEEIATPSDYLRTKEFETSPNMENMKSIISYAGRIWGYDSSIHSIRFSHIERPDVFPYDEARVKHAIRIDGAWQARVQAMHLMPGNGGIYVFFPRAIRTIRGQQIVTGLFSLEISPETDIDASGGVNGKGTLSPHTIVSYGSLTFYLDTDRKIYSLGGENILQTEEFSLSIQPYLDAATDAEIKAARAYIWESRYHLLLSDKIHILDIQRGYWTTWDVDCDSMLHSIGDREDKLFALVGGEIVEFYNGEASNDTEWLWITNYVDLPFNPNGVRISEVALPHPEMNMPTVEMKVETDRGETEWKEYEVHRGYRFILNTFAQAEARARIHVRGTGEIPRFNELYIGVN